MVVVVMMMMFHEKFLPYAHTQFMRHRELLVYVFPISGVIFLLI